MSLIATLTQNTILSTKDEAGNLVILYPATSTKNIDGFQESLSVLSNIIGSATYKVQKVITLKKDNWSADGKLSLASETENGKYDIQLYPLSNDSNKAEYEAFCSAQIVGSANKDEIQALGEIPEIDISVIALITAKAEMIEEA